MKKTYAIQLNKVTIGTTVFAYADVSMGVVFGTVLFQDINSPYDFLKEYCLQNGIGIDAHIPKINL
ncbi:hypothetical protein SAMN05216480_102255 [Pustulibacterium marinum]|uniref:Uncharacterized protein n=1 Tax=Pustulibacterium marinum TaxID=1224947 RepID=A0A1I7FUZ8_9FLAO|nr:hypothetical protein [Pustulibacterium marinum]SFU39950.1 hypothetical protein SAMN05216480_102255 [Pustulibacterium marinum]